MLRRTLVILLCAATMLVVLGMAEAQAQQAFGRQWGRSYTTQDWNRLYHYPYVWYPQNFWGQITIAAAKICTTDIRPK